MITNRSVDDYEKIWNKFDGEGKIVLPKPGKYLINDKNLLEVMDVIDRSRGKGYDSVLLATRSDFSGDIEYFWIDMVDWCYNAKRIEIK